MLGQLNPCKHCGGTSHLSWRCRQKARIEHVKVTRLKKGKIGKQWDITRAQWFKDHPQEYFECYLQVSPLCPKTMHRKQTTLDHIKSRGRHPELRFTQSNLAPACWPCNMAKGSKNLEEIKEIK